MTVAQLVEKFPLLAKNVRNDQFDFSDISIVGHGADKIFLPVYSLESLNEGMEEVLNNNKIQRAWIQNERYTSSSPARMIKFK